MRLEMITREPETELHTTPILFIHGAWCSAWYWDEHFLPYFASQGYSSHAVSLSGHGGSEGHERLFWTGIKDYIEDVAEVSGRLEKPPVLVGHSMGGWVVQKYLEKHSAPAAVLLASLPVKGLVGVTLRISRWHPLLTLKSLLTFNPSLLVSDSGVVRELFCPAGMPEDEFEEFFARLQKESYRAIQEMLFLARPKPDKVKKTPMLLLCAADDNACTVEEEKQTASAYGIQAEVYPGMSHMMMLEDGSQDVADRIIAWLQELGL